jgi:hypothetical protein
LFGRGGAERDGQVGLAGAGVAEQHEGFTVVDPGAAGEVARAARTVVAPRRVSRRRPANRAGTE